MFTLWSTIRSSLRFAEKNESFSSVSEGLHVVRVCTEICGVESWLFSTSSPETPLKMFQALSSHPSLTPKPLTPETLNPLNPKLPKPLGPKP